MNEDRCLPGAGEDHIEIEVEVVEEAAGRGVVGDKESDIIVIRDTLVIAILVVHTTGLGVHQNELSVVLQVKTSYMHPIFLSS